MSDDTSMLVTDAAKQARQNPNDASEAIQTLFDYVEDDGSEATSAAKSLASIARRAPDAFDSQTANFEGALKTTHDLHARWKLVEAVNHLIEQQAISPHDAGKALTEATRVTTDQKYWEERPKRGLRIIQDGLKGWADVAAMGEPVPEDIVEWAIELIELEDSGTLIHIIDVLQAAVESDSPGMDTAFQNLVELTRVEDPTPTVKSEATIAVAELVLSGDVPDEDTARDIITANTDAVRRDKERVEQALAELSS